MTRALAMALVLLAASPTQARASDCTPAFPYRDGWLGADAAYSVPLSPTRSLWLFGDTFVGAASQKKREGAKMVGNTIAISSCVRGRWDIRYFWGDRHSPRLYLADSFVARKLGSERDKEELVEKSEAYPLRDVELFSTSSDEVAAACPAFAAETIRQTEPNPRSFFEPDVAELRYWPLDGFVAGGALYVALNQIRNKPEGGEFGFEGIGVKLARVRNFQDSPDRWAVDYLDLAAGLVAFPGVAAIVRGSYVHLYTVLDDSTHKDHPMILARIPLRGLDQPNRRIQYLAKNRLWKPGLAWQDALVVMEHGHTEMSVRYHARMRRWIAVQPGPFLSNQTVARVSRGLEGPWSPPQTIHEAPEMIPGSEHFDKDTFCYAGKEHAELRGRDGTLLVTYACNSHRFEKLVENMWLNQPQAVRVSLASKLPKR